MNTHANSNRTWLIERFKRLKTETLGLTCDINSFFELRDMRSMVLD